MTDLDDKQRDYTEKVQLEYVKMAHAEWLEGFKGVKEFSTNAIRMLYVLNGGTLLALLALIGNLYAKLGSGEQMTHVEKFIQAVLPAFAPFVIGLILAGLVSTFAYLNYSSIETSLPNSARLFKWLKGEKVDVSAFAHNLPTLTARIGIVTGLLSLGAFGCGCWRVYQAFQLLADAPK